MSLIKLYWCIGFLYVVRVYLSYFARKNRDDRAATFFEESIGHHVVMMAFLAATWPLFIYFIATGNKVDD